MKILIVGAGPTGLTAAIELARRGVIPVVVDKRQGASPLSRAVGITPASLERLNPSGAAPHIIKLGIALEKSYIYRHADLMLEMPMRSETSFTPHMIALPQDQTEKVLGATLRHHGGEINFATELVRLRTEGEQIIAGFADQREAIFDHVIGADGINSAVRRIAGIPYRGYDVGEEWSIADVAADGWRHPKAIALFQGAPGVVSMAVPIGKNRVRVVANTDNALGALPVPMKIVKSHRKGKFMIAARQADYYSKGRVHLAGDAAHCHSPVGGRGMNIGIEDAAELAGLLLAGEIALYHPNRYKAGRKSIMNTEKARKMITSQSRVRRLVTSGMFSLARSMPAMAQRMGQAAVEF